MPAVPQAIVDTLNSLLEAEVNSIFCFVMSGSPYMNEASTKLRQLMKEMDDACHRHRRLLAKLVESVGGLPRVHNRVPVEEQYLSFLSLKFLLPKLVQERELLMTRFENARTAIGDEYPQVLSMLKEVESEQRAFLKQLRLATAEVTGGRYQPAVTGE